MAAEPDFGFSKVEWEQTTAENVKLVEAEYRQRFEGTLNGSQDLDKKAQFVLTGLIGLVTAILGLTFSQAKNLEPQYLVGLFMLAVTFGLGAIFASVSVYPRTYAHLGTTPADLNVAGWLPLLKGDDKSALRLSGIRIKEYARAIQEHENENRKKSRWLKLAVIATVLSFPVALASVGATVSVLVLLNPSKAAVVAPVEVPVRAP